jgi:hypothetical protein
MKVLTANRLIDGEAVWLAAGGRWAESIDEADVAHEPAAEERLQAIGEAALRNNEVVDVVLIDVVIEDGRIRPVRLRERIRASGPTNRRDLGKQARQGVPHAA